MTKENVDIDTEKMTSRDMIEDHLAYLKNTILETEERKTEIFAISKVGNQTYATVEISRNTLEKYRDLFVGNIEGVGGVVVSATEPSGITVEVLNSNIDLNDKDLSRNIGRLLVNLGNKINAVTEETDSNTPEAISKALEELNK